MQKYDLHTHFFTNWEKGKFSLERRERTPKYVLNGMMKKELDGIVFCNVGNRGVWRYAFEQLREALKDREKLGKYSLVRKLDNALEFSDNERLYKIIRGHEIPTKEGHIVVIGLNAGEMIPSGLRLETVLKEIEKLGGISNACHVFGLFGIGKENLEKYKEEFDIFEGKNMNYENRLLKSRLGLNPSEEELNEIAKHLKINWIAVSDCHRARDVGNAYIEIEELLDFSNEDNLLDSLKDLLVKKKFENAVRKANPLLSIARHIIINKYDCGIRTKYGWTNLE